MAKSQDKQSDLEKGYVDMGRLRTNEAPGEPEKNNPFPAGSFGGSGDDKPHPVPPQWR